MLESPLNALALIADLKYTKCILGYKVQRLVLMNPHHHGSFSSAITRLPSYMYVAILTGVGPAALRKCTHSLMYIVHFLV